MLPLVLDGVDAPPRPILKYYAFEATRRASFSVPIFILFFLDRGLSLAQVGALEALWTVVVLGFETPTGYLGDRIGRRWSLFVGTLVTASGAIAFIFASTFVGFAAIISARAIGSTFVSGTQEAWLYDTLRARAETDAFAGYAGRAGAVATAVHGIAALVGGALYSMSPSLPWILEGIVVAIGGLIVLSVPEPSDSATDRRRDRLSPLRALRVATDSLRTRDLGVLVGFTALLFGLFNTLEIYVQPISTEVIGIAPAHLGLLYAGFAAVSAVAAATAGWIDAEIGIRRWFSVAPLLVGAALVTVAIAPILAVPVFVLARAVGRVSRPLFGQYINDRTPSDARATALSAASTIRSLVTAPLNLVGGALTGLVVLPSVIGILGGVLIAGAVLTALAWKPAPPDAHLRAASNRE